MLRWGICCCGDISQDFTSAVFEYQSVKNKAVAVAGRNEDNAKLFAERFNLKYYFGSYDKLGTCDEVDIVYVGSTDSEHCKLVKLFLNHGKHVLVEKTMGRNVAETEEMIALAREKKLFLMEGLWSVFFPIFKKIRNVIDDGVIGKVVHVNANLQYLLLSNAVWAKDFGRGIIRGFGIYVIKFALWIFNDRNVEKISANIKKNENGVDMCATISMEFEDSGTAFLTIHGLVDGDTCASIYGDKGSIILPKTFYAPQYFVVNGQEDRSLCTQRNNLDITYKFDNGFGFIHEINHVSDCIERGLLESDIHPLSESLRLAQIMEHLLTEG